MLQSSSISIRKLRLSWWYRWLTNWRTLSSCHLNHTAQGCLACIGGRIYYTHNCNNQKYIGHPLNSLSRNGWWNEIDVNDIELHFSILECKLAVAILRRAGSYMSLLKQGCPIHPNWVQWTKATSNQTHRKSVRDRLRGTMQADFLEDWKSFRENFNVVSNKFLPNVCKEGCFVQDQRNRKAEELEQTRGTMQADCLEDWRSFQENYHLDS